MTDIDYDKAINLSPLAWDHGCEWNRRYKERDSEVRDRDDEIRTLRKELERRRQIIAALIQKAGGIVALDFEDQDDAYSKPVDVFGWRAEYIVLRIAKTGDPLDAAALDWLDRLPVGET